MKVCPYCAEKIQEEAAKCRFCGEWLDPSKRPAWSLDFAALGEQLGQQLSTAAERGELGTDALSSIRSTLEQKLGAATAPQAAPHEPTREGAASMATPPWSPSGEDSGGQVSAWEPPTWLAPGQAPGQAPAPAPPEGRAPAEAAPAPASPAPAEPSTVDRSEAPTRPEARPEARPAANEEPSPQFVPPGRAATAAAVQPEAAPAPAPAEPVVAHAPARPQAQASSQANQTAGEIELPNERASLEEVAARMERLKATADAVQRTLAEKAAERSASGASLSPSGESASRVPSEPAVERSGRGGTLLQGTRVAGPEESGPSGKRKRSGTMDRLEQSILGDDRDEFGDLDSEGSGFGSTSFGDAISARRPIPWGPIVAGIAVVGVIGYFMFRPDDGTAGTETAAAENPPADTAGADPTKADEKKADEKAPPPEPANGETGAAPADEGGEAAAEGGEPAADSGGADGGEPAADSGGEPSAESGGAEAGDTPPPPADEALTEKLAEAEKSYKRRKYDDALAAIDEALKMSPNHPDALVLLANVQLEKGDLEAALGTATKCVGIDAAKADCWLAIAALQEANENPAKALEAWKKYLEHAPGGQYASSAKSAIRRLEKKLGG